ncbi:hypothetical protein P4O66_001917 [Electrophorus voltai]|uniref:Uncharacterized protein n=1 Tax=Electrophorus voltai TaxID=2609070 RepID=A0AAD8Z447_9TELE|nr:hypothetical protein P4O66_001917 [Electrophorus voltai]
MVSHSLNWEVWKPDRSFSLCLKHTDFLMCSGLLVHIVSPERLCRSSPGIPSSVPECLRLCPRVSPALCPSVSGFVPECLRLCARVSPALSPSVSRRAQTIVSSIGKALCSTPQTPPLCSSDSAPAYPDKQK